MNKLITLAVGVTALLLTHTGQADVVTADDVIITGSECVGFDCVNGENFGADTIRLKENNLRIHIDDTSSTSSFPANDWRLTFNDSASGGASYFSVDDVTGGKVPFKVTAGAPTNSLFISSSGNLGLGTETPVLDIHLITGDTPAMRLEQNTSSGYTAQTWDIAGNEANFFVRDVTGGSKLPFRIRPGAPTSSIDIAASGNVGIGTASPDAPLDIERTSNTTPLVLLTNAGPARLHMSNSTKTTTGNEAQTWVLNSNGTFRISYQGTSTTPLALDTAGNLTILGTLTQSSDVTQKENIKVIDGQTILDRLAKLPITTWNYKNDSSKTRHLGPMAQDFYSLFNLGATNTGIAALDADGIALASIQQLNKKLLEKEKTIMELQERLDKLESLMAKLAANGIVNTNLAYNIEK